MNPQKLVIATVVYPSQTSEINARFLIESIRTFGGSFSNAIIWCLLPKIGEGVSSSFIDFCKKTGSERLSYEIQPEAARFPLAADIVGAAYAESNALKTFNLLVWLGANTIVFQEPQHFIIPDHACIGYCPVHHTNIGSNFDTALDPFWSEVYRACKVPSDRVFPMNTQVDGKTLRPYFNATSLVVRPERGVFAAWRDVFFATYQQQGFKKFYEQDDKYAIFMHQAILTGIILAVIDLKEMVKLPSAYNYPLHLWQEDVTNARPHRLDELVTARHEVFYRNPNWRETMPEGNDLKDWLAQRTK
jgi:hypothetical protein